MNTFCSLNFEVDIFPRFRIIENILAKRFEI